MLASIMVLGPARHEVTSWVSAVVPLAVTPVHARAVVAGTLFLTGLAVIAGLTLRVGATAGGLGRGEQRLVAGAGFLTGLLALPFLGAVV